MKARMAGWVAAVALALASGAARAEVVDRIVAKVGTEMITQFDLDQAVSLVRQQMDPAEVKAEQGTQAEKDERAKILDSMIDQKLVILKAKAWDQDNKKDSGDSSAAPNPYLPDDADVEKQTDQQVEQIESQDPTATAFQAALQDEHLNEDSFRSKIRDQVRDGLIYQAMRKEQEKEFQGSVTVGDGEARDYYNAHPDLFSAGQQVQLAQIVLPDGAAGEAEARKVKAQLEGGAEFAALAKRLSHDRSRFNGGMLGWIGKGQMKYPQLEKAAFAAKEGDIVGPIHTEDGWHLLKVLGFKQASQQTFDQVKNQVKNYLYTTKMNDKLGAWVKQLRQTNFVQTFPGD